MSVLTLEAKLERAETNTPWGFRMQGGKDFSSPLTIQRVNPGSLAAKCGLQVGDIILKIGNVGADVMRHKEAQDSIVASGNRLDLLLQRGGSAPSYDKFSPPQTISFNSVPKAPPVAGSNQPSSNSNFNASARPFGASAPSAPSVPSAPSAPSYGGSNIDNITNRTQNLSMEPDYKAAAQKYSDGNEPQPTSHQSYSFRMLQNMMDTGQEPPSAFKPSPAPSAAPSSAHPPQPYIAQPVGPGNKPGTVKAIVSQKYNTPIGLYSDKNVATTFKGQSKFLVSPDEGEELEKVTPTVNGNSEPAGPKKYQPSETYKLIHEQEAPKESQPAHSRSFKFLQQQLGEKGPSSGPVPYNPPAPKPAATWAPKPAPVPSTPAAKTWTPSAAPVAPAAPSAPKMPPAKPSGVGAIRGKRGDASMQNQGGGMMPKSALCASCGNTIRGPFVLAMGKSWCPEHFICANPPCGRKLIDIGFVEEGGYLYCEQDYANHFAPRCNKCSQAVVGECVNALSKQWHPQCFLCAKCNTPIGGTQFHIEEGKPYCERDWGALFQTMCAGCEFPIEPGDRWVEAMSKNFHSECFYCMTCQVSLEGQPFYCKGGKPFCKKHAR